ncbi:hypothetical protein J5U18_11240 [Sphingobacteriaceae bacterium WQ 2009]|uniref:Acyl-ACP thioesterase n=1 Tax=Rhinopithecimicrobium faecis TaxID=2820698 RepID=A0A8T4HFK3_9SPHI|nr:hypothetical protein [Sphingobacteriaceae bacterium WQ 2009]
MSHPLGYYSRTWDINFSQCYANGKLKYSEISNLFQITAGEHAEALDFSFQTMLTFNQAWVMSRMRIELNKLPKLGDQVELTTWIQDFDGARSTRNFTISKDGVTYISGSSYWAVINFKLRKSENLAINTDHVKLFPSHQATAFPVDKLNIFQACETVDSHRVRLSDLDVVRHVNNVKYVDWCLDQLDIEDVLQKPIASIAMNFLRELTYDDIAEIQHQQQENVHFMRIQRTGKVAFAMELTFSK